MDISVELSNGWINGDLIKKNPKTCWVRLPGGNTIKRRYRQTKNQLEEFAGVLEVQEKKPGFWRKAINWLKTLLLRLQG